MVPAVSLVGLLVYFVATGAIGTRLLRLWWRTRELPELSTGIGYIAAGTLGWSLVLAGHAPPIIDTPIGLAVQIAAVFFLSVGSLSVAIGTWRIFRPQHAWVGAICGVLALLLIVDFVHNAVLQHTPFVRATSPWYWPGAIGRAVAFVWSPLESTRYYRLLRLRLRLGLVEPVVVNRFLLWAISGLTSLATTVLALGGTILDVDLSHPDAFLAAYAVLGVTGALALWLAFFPPQRYLDAIEGRTSSEGGET